MHITEDNLIKYPIQKKSQTKTVANCDLTV